ncbi:hypothetical protein SDC9_199745 [bioreactor metagenome]|uniref:Uncharacterized protein n=1 Tax=bioreactor metagenome TaxID=1076179 RepID=A0A645ILC6_9ZZZZ
MSIRIFRSFHIRNVAQRINIIKTLKFIKSVDNITVTYNVILFETIYYVSGNAGSPNHVFGWNLLPGIQSGYVSVVRCQQSFGSYDDT